MSGEVELLPFIGWTGTAADDNAEADKVAVHSGIIADNNPLNLLLPGDYFALSSLSMARSVVSAVSE